jgi:hypothetical protein
VYVDRYEDLGSIEPPPATCGQGLEARAKQRLPHSALAAAEHRIRLLSGEVWCAGPKAGRLLVGSSGLFLVPPNACPFVFLAK